MNSSKAPALLLVLGIGAFLLVMLVAFAFLFGPAGTPSVATLPEMQDSELEDASTTEQTAGEGSSPLDDVYAAYAQRDPKQFLEAVEVALKLPLSNANQQILQALQLNLQEDSEAALQLLHSAAQDPNAKAKALNFAGEILFLRGDMQDAEHVLKAALEADSKQVEPHRYLAAFYYDVGAMDHALSHLDQVAQLAPEDVRPWRMRGMILADFERHNEAIEAYRQAQQKNAPKHVADEIQLELAESLLAARQPEEALAELGAVPATPTSLSLAADCDLALGKLESAEKKLQAALKKDPIHARSLMLKASVAREQGRLEDACKTLEMAVEHHPYEFDFRFHLMSAYNATGEREKADAQRKEMDRLRDLRTRFTELHHQSMQDLNSSALRLELGQTAMELGKFEMAASWFRAALALDPDNDAAMQALTSLENDAP